jgi:LPS sulfotransferase NodH
MIWEVKKMKNNFLEVMNSQLIGLDSRLEIDGDANHNIFIIGAPRSGTTLLSQLFSGCANAGYPNNLMAAFWNAPITGALLSKRWSEDKIFTGNSDFGQTSDYREPHEFGAFWRSSLLMDGMEQPNDILTKTINWNHLANTLEDISRVFSVPVVYKAFHLAWFIREISTVLPDSKWIWITRNTVDNARSLLDLRRHMHNDINKWASSKPVGIEKYCVKDPYLEVVAQVELINQWIEFQLKEINQDNWVSLSLESLVADPVAMFKKVATWSGVEMVDENLKLVAENIQPEVFTNDQEYTKIKNAYKNFSFKK